MFSPIFFHFSFFPQIFDSIQLFGQYSVTIQNHRCCQVFRFSQLVKYSLSDTYLINSQCPDLTEIGSFLVNITKWFECWKLFMLA